MEKCEHKLEEIFENGMELYNAEIKRLDVSVIRGNMPTLSMSFSLGCSGIGLPAINQTLSLGNTIIKIVSLLDENNDDEVRLNEICKKKIYCRIILKNSMLYAIGNIIDDRFITIDELMEIKKSNKGELK